MTSFPGFLHHDPRPASARPEHSLFDILGALGPAPRGADDEYAAPFRAACALEAARRGRPAGPPRPTPHGAAPPAA